MGLSVFTRVISLNLTFQRNGTEIPGVQCNIYFSKIISILKVCFGSSFSCAFELNSFFEDSFLYQPGSVTLLYEESYRDEIGKDMLLNKLVVHLTMHNSQLTLIINATFELMRK